VAPVAQGLAGLVQRKGVVPGIGGQLAHQGDEVGLHPCRLPQTLERSAGHPGMDKDRDGGVIAGDIQRLKMGHGFRQRLGRQAADLGQLIGQDPQVGRRSHQVTGDRE